MALSGHATGAVECLLSGAKQTSLITIPMSANDPKRTLSHADLCGQASAAMKLLLDHRVLARPSYLNVIIFGPVKFELLNRKSGSFDNVLDSPIEMTAAGQVRLLLTQSRHSAASQAWDRLQTPHG
jgi:hypothetical protein